MRKVLTVVLAAIIAISCFALPAFADEETVSGDGFDFYSMTAHYTEPVVVSYVYVTKADNVVKKDANGNPLKDDDGNDVLVDKGWIFADPADSYIIPAVAFTSKDGSFTNFAPGYGEKELGKGKYADKFYSIVAPAYNMDSSKIAINNTYGLTDIADNTAISIKSAATLFGAMEYYDDAGTPNPNFTLVNGYFLDQAVDEDGNNLRIDVNGYVIDKNNIWHARDGHRIEPFVEVGEDADKNPILVWIDLKSRIGEDGKVLDYTTITNEQLIGKGVLTMPAKYANLAEEFDETVDYNDDGKVGDRKDKSAYNSLVKEKKAWLTGCSIQMYTMDYIDLDGDGKKTERDLAYFLDQNENEEYDEGEPVGYDHPDYVVTQKNIMTKTDKEGNLIYIQGSPAIGNPVTKVKISKLTVEIDALGTQLYSDVASDPQQQNEIIVTTGDIYKNVKKALDYVAENPDKEYTSGQIIGTAKCITTKTEVAEGAGTYPTTVTSVDVTLEEGVQIPANATLYFNFNVKTQQAENTKTYIKKKDYNLLPINKGEVDLTKIPPKKVETPTEEPDQNNGCKNFVGGGFAICAAVALAFVTLRKKEH
ncbi:MAG: hypothetical protein K6G89_02040 [Clostridia bacterium]|nr:hypothetical protein [Clostridia bacterium]